MIDGPGPPVTSRVTVRPLPLSVAWIRSGDASRSSSRETHKILLLRLASGGACSGSAHKMATMPPRAPITYGIGCAGGLNPARAQAGSGRGVITARHPPAAAGRAAEPVILAGGFAGLDGWLEEHPAPVSVASKISAALRLIYRAYAAERP
jgi:hypothetical protein